MKPAHHPSSGFTLLELSVVIVIIGLLIGGIMIGKEMFLQSKIRQAISTVQQFDTAAATFKEKYGGLPGDLTNATAIWGERTQGCPYYPNNVQNSVTRLTCNGNGDGRIAPNQSWGGNTETNPELYVGWQEGFLFFQHLSNAGLIPGAYIGSTEAPFGYSQTGTTFSSWPNSPFGLRARWAISWVNPSLYAGYGYAVVRDHQFILGGFRVSTGTALTHQPIPQNGIFPPAVAFSIDKKMDDGVPLTGSVISNRYPWSSSGSRCTINDVPSTAVYSLSVTANNCMLFFKPSF